MQQAADKILLQKFLRGDCTANERLVVEAILQRPDAAAMLDQIMEEDAAADWEQLRKQPVVTDKQMKLWQARFKERIYPKQAARVRFHLPLLKYAAILIAVIVGAGYYGLQQYKKNQLPAQLVYRMKKTGRGEMTIIKLTDSTTVYLNAASTLKFPENFSGKTREVYLDGEAFFDVAHDQNKPFFIHTDKVKIQVLGTSFDVSAYSNDKSLSVAVATGRVGVLNKMQEKQPAIGLLAGDQLVYSRSDGRFHQLKINPDDVSAWQNNLMIFNNETLESITHRLERWYNVGFVFKNKKLVQMEFKLKSRNENLQTIMNALSASGNFHYKIEGAQVILW